MKQITIFLATIDYPLFAWCFSVTLVDVNDMSNIGNKTFIKYNVNDLSMFNTPNSIRQIVLGFQAI